MAKLSSQFHWAGKINKIKLLKSLISFAEILSGLRSDGSTVTRASQVRDQRHSWDFKKDGSIIRNMLI